MVVAMNQLKEHLENHHIEVWEYVRTNRDGSAAAAAAVGCSMSLKLRKPCTVSGGWIPRCGCHLWRHEGEKFPA